jgi:hypothetical protein
MRLFYTTLLRGRMRSVEFGCSLQPGYKAGEAAARTLLPCREVASAPGRCGLRIPDRSFVVRRECPTAGLVEHSIG